MYFNSALDIKIDMFFFFLFHGKKFSPTKLFYSIDPVEWTTCPICMFEKMTMWIRLQYEYISVLLEVFLRY